MNILRFMGEIFNLLLFLLDGLSDVISFGVQNRFIMLIFYRILLVLFIISNIIAFLIFSFTVLNFDGSVEVSSGSDDGYIGTSFQPGRSGRSHSAIVTLQKTMDLLLLRLIRFKLLNLPS